MATPPLPDSRCPDTSVAHKRTSYRAHPCLQNGVSRFPSDTVGEVGAGWQSSVEGVALELVSRPQALIHTSMLAALTAST